MSSSYKKSENTSSTLWFHCLVKDCNYKTDRHTDLKRHYKAKHPPTLDEVFQCSYNTCTKEYKRKDHLRDHSKRVHYRDLPAEYGGTGRRLSSGTSSKSRYSSNIGPPPNVGTSSNIQQAADRLDQEMRSLDITYRGPPGPTGHPYLAESSLKRPNNGALHQTNSSNAFDDNASVSLLPQYEQSQPDQFQGPRCRERGCEGRVFSSYSSLLRHEREKHGLY